MIGLVLGFIIGLGCSFLAIPVPAPPVLVGALLVVAMTVGYSVTDHYSGRQVKDQQKHCGGPTGEPKNSEKTS